MHVSWQWVNRYSPLSFGNGSSIFVFFTNTVKRFLPPLPLTPTSSRAVDTLTHTKTSFPPPRVQWWWYPVRILLFVSAHLLAVILRVAIQSRDSFSSLVNVSQETRLWSCLVSASNALRRRLAAFHVDLHSRRVLVSICRWSKYIHNAVCVCVCVEGWWL